MRAAVNPFVTSGTQPDRNTAMQSEQNIVSINRDPTMIEFKGVSKFFERRNQFGDDNDCLNVALDRVNANVGKGEFITLLGPSGCGKTTLLRLAAGLMRPDEGVITIQGQEVTAPRRDACMVFQNFGLLPWRTALANVEFPLEIDGVAAETRHAEARELLALVGLERFAEHYPHELSGGMQQRVAIARALIRKPLLILLDEPFGALDAQTREQLQEDFLRIWSRTGATVLFVTHSLDESMLLSDRIFVFASNPGRILTIVDSPLAKLRLVSDMRMDPQFGECRAELRHLLGGV
jgi:NitT/TauT family transport system ATP-binding protein